MGHDIINAVGAPFGIQFSEPSEATKMIQAGINVVKGLMKGITASLPAAQSCRVRVDSADINSALSKAAAEEKSGTSQLAALTSHKDQLQALRAKEEARSRS